AGPGLVESFAVAPAPAATTIAPDAAGGAGSVAGEQANARGPPAGAVLIIASQGGSVISGAATLTFAPGSLPADAWVTVTPVSVVLHGTVTHAYDLKAVDTRTGELIELFNVPPVLTVASQSPIGQAIWYVPADGSAP